MSGLVLALLFAGALRVRAEDIGGWSRDRAHEAWSQARGDLHGSADPRDIAWTVQVVANDGWSTTAELVATRPWNGPASLRYARTVGQSLVVQLDALQAASPRIGVAEAAASLQVRRGALVSETCPAAVAIAERLPEITIAALPLNRLTLDAPFYEVTLSATHRSGRTLSVEKGENDLARWCEAILAAVVECEARPGRE